jgi:hypothetical protein
MPELSNLILSLPPVAIATVSAAGKNIPVLASAPWTAGVPALPSTPAMPVLPLIVTAISFL